ncbi:MAG: hypothetical protein CMI16_12620 [Opitutaceae bacterium]|nr:hypothetical protein [Opitutaceae bacterium]
MAPRLTLARSLHADRRVEIARQVPDGMDARARGAYVALSKRARQEAVAVYSVLALGLQNFAST